MSNIEFLYGMFMQKVSVNVAKEFGSLPYSVENAEKVKQYVDGQIQFVLDRATPDIKPVVQAVFGNLEAKIIFDEHSELPMIQLVQKEK